MIAGVECVVFGWRKRWNARKQAIVDVVLFVLSPSKPYALHLCQVSNVIDSRLVNANTIIIHKLEIDEPIRSIEWIDLYKWNRSKIYNRKCKQTIELNWMMMMLTVGIVCLVVATRPREYVSMFCLHTSGRRQTIRSANKLHFAATQNKWIESTKHPIKSAFGQKPHVNVNWWGASQVNAHQAEYDKDE